MQTLHLFATSPRGTESLLADELRALGADAVKEARSGASFQGDLRLAYRVCLWSRVANRVLLPLARFPAANPEELYDGVREIDWSAHLGADQTLAVDFNTNRSQITHSHYGALKVKDAIVDQFRDRTGTRPSVATERPDLQLNVFLQADVATISVDLSGESLHRRGYRIETVTAPLKENLAAAILLRARWPETARAGGALVDLMCGSGTLPIEAALIASDSAPGLRRSHYGFIHWRQHQAAIWDELRAAAEARRAAGLQTLPPIRGYDHDSQALGAALANVEHAGLNGHVHIERRALGDCRAERGAPPGLVVVNPPYGERLGKDSDLPDLYRRLGDCLRRSYSGWRAAVLTATYGESTSAARPQGRAERHNPDLGKVMGLHAHKLHTLYNGAIECRLLHFDVQPERFVRERPVERLLVQAPANLTPGAEMFANRLRKNLKTLGKWARQESLCCYRLYDADMPEYAVAIDVYQGAERWVHVQEYAAPASIDPRKAEERLHEAVGALPGVLDVPATNLFLKVRQQQKGAAQYQRQGEAGDFHEVLEDGRRLLVNFTEYLDTGLFLDHRPTRRLLGTLARGKRFLNLFCYTGAATVHAAAGGASATTSVDLSNTYLDWARRNLALNGFSAPAHKLVQADVFEWLEQPSRERFGLIFLDPPTFSNSKRMQGTLDIQRDHVALIQAAGRRLEPDGILLFSTNFRRFRLDRDALAAFSIEDLTRATLPRDFARNPRIHQCFRLTHRGGDMGE